MFAEEFENDKYPEQLPTHELNYSQAEAKCLLYGPIRPASTQSVAVHSCLR